MFSAFKNKPAFAAGLCPEQPVARSRARHKLQAGMILLLLLALQIPFYLTHCIQEDAYITFRTAFHLADYGTFSYNLGEHTTGVTSMLFGLAVAALRKIFGEWAIGSILVFNTLAFLVGALLLSRILFRDHTRQLAILVLISTCPIAITICTYGMEIPLQVLAIAWVAYTLREGKPSPWTLAGIFLLPLIRPDAVAYALLFTLLVFTFRRVYGALALLATMGGCAMVLVFNKTLTGHYVTNTMRAKELSYHPSHALLPVLHRVLDIYVTHSYLAPFPLVALYKIGIIFTLLLVGAALITIRSNRASVIRHRLLSVLFIFGIAIPACYAYGGVIFSWYLWTGTWLMTVFGCYVLVAWLARMNPRRIRLAAAAVAIAWFGVYAIFWVLALNGEMGEYHYRGDIGRYIHKIAAPNDTLLLEPAGYIPFYAGIYTTDEIGLVSDKVLDYRYRYGGHWYIPYLKEQRPTFVLEPHDGTVSVSPEEWNWFLAHYEQVAGFHYNPMNYSQPRVLLRLTKLARSSASDYQVYRSNGRP